VSRVKPEGRTQLVGYAVARGLAKATEARTMDLEHLRRVVDLHRLAIRNRNKLEQISEPSATTAEKE
jgi:hypothetical protein